jgi:hypothetical protein
MEIHPRMAWIYNPSMSSPALPWNGTLLLDAHVAVLQGHAGGSASRALRPSTAVERRYALAGRSRWRAAARPTAVAAVVPAARDLSAPEAGCTVFLEPAHADPKQIQQHLHSLPGTAMELHDWLPRLSRPQPLDRRVQAALARIAQHLPGPVPAADIAEAAHLSTSQLHRRFQSERR